MELKTFEECRSLLQAAGLPQKVREHSEAVASLAAELAEALNASGCSLDAELCWRAGLLHDICRTQDRHDERGKSFLEERGFTMEAEIAGAHLGKGIDFDEASASITEKEVVYLADKLVMGSERAPLERRFKCAMERYGGEPEAAESIRNKFAQALIIEKKVERILNRRISGVEPVRGAEEYRKLTIDS